MENASKIFTNIKKGQIDENFKLFIMNLIVDKINACTLIDQR